MSNIEHPSGPAGILGNLKPILYGVLAGILVCMACLLLFAGLLSSQNMPQAVIHPMTIVAFILGGFTGGFVCSRMVRENGLVYGCVVGAILSLLMMLVSLGFSDGGVGVPALLKTLLILLGAAIGGVLGVNTRVKKRSKKSKRRK